MADSRQRTLVSVRAICNHANLTKVFARSASTKFGVPFSFDRAESGLAGEKILPGLLVTGVTAVFSNSAGQRPLAVDRIEVTAKVELNDSLRYRGVIGAAGTPSCQNLQLKAYVDSPKNFLLLDEAWQDAVTRAPPLNTLQQGQHTDYRRRCID